MSEFDKLKDAAEQYAKDHPEQVKKGEQEVENELGIGQQGQGQQGQRPDGGGERDQGTAGQEQ
jgi:hypothetical protein